MLEFRADPESRYHDQNFAKDKTVILYCASGGRAALGGQALKDLGYGEVYNLGAFKDWGGRRRGRPIADKYPGNADGPHADSEGPVLRMDRESLQPSGLRCGPVVLALVLRRA